MAALRQFQLYFKGQQLLTINKSGIYYDELVNHILSPAGAGKASSFKNTMYNDNEMSYDVTIDTGLYPTLEDYAKAVYTAFVKQADADATYEIIRTKEENPRDVIYFVLQDKQKVELSPVTSASEVELEKKAVETEQPKPEEKKPEAPAIEQKAPPPPIIVTPTEKTTIVGSKDVSKEKTLIESISGSVFDKKILEYEKSSIEKEKLEGVKEKSASSTTSTNIKQGGIISESMLLKDVALLKEIVQMAAPKEERAASETIVPTDVSRFLSTIISSGISEYEASLARNEIASASKTQTDQIKDAVTAMRDTIRLIEESTKSTSSLLEKASQATSEVFSSVAKETSGLVDLVSSKTMDESKKLKESLVVSEKTSMENKVLTEIQEKVTEMETQSGMSQQLGDLTTGITNAIKNMVTSITQTSKTNTVEMAPSQKMALTPPTGKETTINQGETSTANLGTQTNQTLFGGQTVFPSVVSLSQSTIDNLASAIIKNMSITPFLNSGH